MDALRTILVVVDPKAPESPAVAKAKRLARAFRAAVELLICDATPTLVPALYPDYESLAAVLEPMEAHHQLCLDAVAAPFERQGLAVTTRVEFGKPLYAALLSRIAAASPDLVIKDTHHHSLAQRTLITNTDWHLIRDCPVPLLLVKPHAWPDVPRVVAAVDTGHPGDPSDFLTHGIIDTAALLARGFGTLPELVHAWSPASLLVQTSAIGAPGWPVMSAPQELIGTFGRLDAEQLAHLARVHDIEAQQVHRLVGAAVEVLPEFVEREPTDVLVMGAVSRSALERIFIGNTAEHVLERVPCDVFVVKLPNRSAEHVRAGRSERAPALAQ